MIELIEGKKHDVIKRNGKAEPYNCRKMRRVLHWAITHDTGIDDNLAKQMVKTVINDVNIRIFDRITIQRLFDEVISTVANKISELQPVWDKVARNLYIQKIYKETWGIKRDQYPDYLEVIKKGIQYKKYDKKVIDSFTAEELKELGEYIKPERDFLFTFGGLNLFMDKYSMRYSKTKHLELPQHTYMRVAIGLHWNDKTDRLQKIKDEYDILSTHLVTKATPKMLNLLRANPQLASCVLMRPSDCSKSLTDVAASMALFSKFAGGLSMDVSWVSSKGRPIESTGGESSGVVPFIQLYEKVVRAWNQGGKRPGACAVYYDWFHSEAPDTSMLKDAGGKDDERARGLKYAIKWSKLLTERFLNDEDVTLFSPYDTPGLRESFGEEFKKKYEEYEEKGGIKKKRLPAREYVFTPIKVRSETGNIYVFFRDNVDPQRMGRDPVYMSNLCVAPETKILTDSGYKEIRELSGQMVNVWNGEEWSNVEVVKTGENQELLKIDTEGGELYCTPYHKFYVQKGFTSRGKIIEKEAKDLKKNDRLVKFSLPVIEGHTEYILPYEQGFFSSIGSKISADGSLIPLCDGNKEILHCFNGYKAVYHTRNDNKVTLIYPNILGAELEVPSTDVSINSKLLWFSGVIDSCAEVSTTKGRQELKVISENEKYLKDIMLFLQTIGVHSKFTNSDDMEYTLSIFESGIQHLLSLGLMTHRIKLKTRSISGGKDETIKVLSVENTGRKDDTYCFTEPKRHMGMFNGILTGQCNEIYLPVKPLETKSERLIYDLNQKKYVVEQEKEGEIALCNLASMNLVRWDELSHEEKLKTMYVTLLGFDNAIETAYYPSKFGEIFNRTHRAIGLGVSNYANLLASKGIKFTDDAALRVTHEIFEDLTWYALYISTELARERGRYDLFEGSKWEQGMVPIDVSLLHNSDSELNFPLLKDWDLIRNRIKEYGVRFEYHFAIAPTQTSGLAISSSEGTEPIREYKIMKEGTYNLPFMAPNLRENREFYELAWDIPNERLIDLAAIRQKFIDQGQSVNLYYRETNSASVIIKDIIYAESRFLKGLYYLNPMKAEMEICESCSS